MFFTKRKVLMTAALALVALSASAWTIQRVWSDRGQNAEAPGTKLKSPPPRGVAEIDGKLYVNGKEVKRPSQSPKGAGPTESFDPTSPLPDFHNVVRDYEADECDFARGVYCRVMFRGNVFLGSADEGSIYLLVYENKDFKKAVVEAVMAPAMKGRNYLCSKIFAGCTFAGHVDYIPSQNANHVHFVLELKDKSGKVLIHDILQERPIVR